MAKKTSDLQYYSEPCQELDLILLIKKLDKTEAAALYEELKETVASYKKEEKITKYMRLLIKKLLRNPEVLNPYMDVNEPASVNFTLNAVYLSITNIYMRYRIELVCSDINNLVPASLKNPLEVDADDMMEQLEDASPSGIIVVEKQNKFTIEEIEKTTKYLRKRIIGQDEAIKDAMDRLKLIAAGFKKRAALFFIGRTGVGKTELARLFGKRYSGNFCKINCAEYSNGQEVAKLLGSPPGYIGSGNKSFLLERSEKSNKWVFLFDEIEKANEKLFNLLLSILDDGTATDSQGNALDFTNSVFIFTSNQGMTELKEKSVGFGGKPSNFAGDREVIDESVKRLLTPEFRNRIDKFVFFNDLTEENAKKIIELNLKSYPVVITDEIIDFLLTRSYSKEYGVREVKRKIDDYVGMPLAEAILNGMQPLDGSNKFTLQVTNDSLVVIDACVIPPQVLETQVTA